MMSRPIPLLPMLTDMYQLSASYAYWKADKHNDEAVFDLFSKCPFKGEFCIFAGLEERLRLCESFQYTTDDIAYIKTLLLIRQRKIILLGWAD